MIKGITMDINVTFPGGKKVDANVNGFTIKTDQSPAGGGEGSAPEPFLLFLASLSTCAGIYVLGFCQSRGIDSEGISLTQHHIAGPEGGIGKIEISINVPASFPEKYHSALVRVASQCAVKKILQNPPEIETKTVVV
jgi:putative redox protein